MNIRKISLTKKIFAPFILIYFAGISAIFNWNKSIKKLHLKCIKEKLTNVYFTKKCLSLFFKTSLFFVINVFAWFMTFIFFFN